jgi:hypothetical protein
MVPVRPAETSGLPRKRIRIRVDDASLMQMCVSLGWRHRATLPPGFGDGDGDHGPDPRDPASRGSGTRSRSKLGVSEPLAITRTIAAVCGSARVSTAIRFASSTRRCFPSRAALGPRGAFYLRDSSISTAPVRVRSSAALPESGGEAGVMMLAHVSSDGAVPRVPAPSRDRQPAALLVGTSDAICRRLRSGRSTLALHPSS